MSAAVVPSSGSLVRNTTFGPLFPSIERRARATASQRPSTSATFNIRGHAAQAGHLTVLRALHGLVQVSPWCFACAYTWCPGCSHRMREDQTDARIASLGVCAPAWRKPRVSRCAYDTDRGSWCVLVLVLLDSHCLGSPTPGSWR